MRKESKAFLKDLLKLRGPAGWETEVQRRWLAYAKELADETGSDAYGNAYAILNPGGSPRILVVGHADEIGFQVQYISEEGFIYFASVGGNDPSVPKGMRVTIHGSKGEIPGVIGALPIHLQDKKRDPSPPQLHELFIDTGLPDAKAVEKYVKIGDPITIDVGPMELTDTVWTSRACDNRVGIFAAAETLRKCRSNKKLKPCVIAVSTIQEENGHYGAAMVGESLRPDAALVIDVGHATDIPQCNYPRDGRNTLGGGPIICRGSVNHPVLVERLEKAAIKNNIPIQYAIDPRKSSTDADDLFISRGGVPTAIVSVPNRYMHTPAEMIHLRDLDQVSDLLTAFFVKVRKDEGFGIAL